MDRASSPEDIPRLFAEAWNARDAKSLAALFAEDAGFVNVVGHWWRKRADIEKAHAYGLSTFFEGSHLSAKRVEIRRLNEDTVIVHVRWRLVDQIDKDRHRLDERRTVMIFVAEWQRDG